MPRRAVEGHLRHAEGSEKKGEEGKNTSWNIEKAMRRKKRLEKVARIIVDKKREREMGADKWKVLNPRGAPEGGRKRTQDTQKRDEAARREIFRAHQESQDLTKRPGEKKSCKL